MSAPKIFICWFLLLCSPAYAQLKVSPDDRFLQTDSGAPFFWLGDTAWELFHRLTREEADLYLRDRADKGFTIIQAVVLAELDGLNTPNPYGHTPLLNNDPATPNEDYFRDVDYIVKKAEKLGLTLALLPSWGDKWNKAEWGTGPEIFTPANAYIFGKFLGERYRDKPVVWVMGGDRPIVDSVDRDIIQSMAKGIKEGGGGKHLISFHPPGAKSSVDYFPDAGWIDFNMSQTGHSTGSKSYQFNRRNLSVLPAKPHVDSEPRYEDHPDRFDPVKYGWMDDFDIRQSAYWSMLSGAMGHTYGNHNIWQFYTEERTPVSWARTHWRIALNHPGSFQVGLMRKLFEKRNWQQLIPDQSIITGSNPEDTEYQTAAISQDGDFLFAYLPYGRETVLNTSNLKAENLHAWLFDPRDGRTLDLGISANSGSIKINPQSKGHGSDWVVIIDDAGKRYPDPAVLKE